MPLKYAGISNVSLCLYNLQKLKLHMYFKSEIANIKCLAYFSKQHVSKCIFIMKAQM